ncbi:hypothetical protein RvY_15037 [Ramazzottius varieornatus]|uniref:Cation-transporting ATPase n=1 Tax=Ramazzottius varieornatus TaxID=947166 RepID=A0A1D1VV56_RAMVA|nr:hypothetical protein RvY_15037 [Ramazzottius varieornatus]
MAAGRMDGIVLNPGQDDLMYVEPYEKSLPKKIVVWIAIVLTGGILGLVFFWRRDWYAKATGRLTSIQRANLLVLRDTYHDFFVSEVHDMALRTRFYKKPPKGSIQEHAPLTTPSFESKGEFENAKLLRFFDCKRVRYIWNTSTAQFVKLLGIPDEVPLGYFDGDRANGLDDLTRSQRLKLFGLNDIAVKVDPIWKLFVKEGLTVFYMFQLFSIILWYIEPYTVYASVIVAISVLSLTSQVFLTYRQQHALKKRVQDYDNVKILKSDGNTAMVPSETLVPGDIILIPTNGGKVVCDAVLLTGQCIVNESSLTGESVPVSKVAVSSADKDQLFTVRAYTRNMISCGSKILQSRGADGQLAKAMVIRTGFMTSKGELIRSIMYFRNIDFQFQNQTYWYIGALAVMAVIGMIYAIIVLKRTPGIEDSEITIRALDLVTIVVPPALPAALTVGIVFSQWRLGKLKIFCISPRTINMCGLVDLVCFDKTGTLTEDGLELRSVLPAAVPKNPNNENHRFREDKTDVQYSDNEEPMVRAMAACHSLSLMTEYESDVSTGKLQTAKLIGDPLDLIMFEVTQWKVIEEAYPPFGSSIVRIVHSPFARRESSAKADRGVEGLVLIREFPFSSAQQRMGVVVYNTIATKFESFVKGSTEKVVSLCDRNTVPSDCMARLEEFSSQGNRVIALAWKPLPTSSFEEARKVSKAEAESNLTFVGLVVFENRIKPDSPSVIEELTKADIRTVMLTGDNMHTAISIARSCGIVHPEDQVAIVEADQAHVNFNKIRSHGEALLSNGTSANGHLNKAFSYDSQTSVTSNEAEKAVSKEVLALTGDTLQIIRTSHPHLLQQIILQGTVFARVSPLEKQFMVEQFQSVGYQVAMCGDGANDVGALRAAHAGISLSESEAAAAAPFTSTNPSIACVPLVLREGRCALVTFFGIFFLMATYSMSQFISCLLVYWTGVTLTDWQFLYEDLFELTILAIVIAFAEPFHHLSRDPAPSSLKSFPALFSLLGHVTLIMAAQIIAFKVVQTLPCDLSALPNDTTAENGTGSEISMTAGKPLWGTGCETYAVWTVGTIQIVVLSFIFAKGAPYRRPFYTNYLHVICGVGMILFDLVCMLGPTYPILSVYEMSKPADSVFGSRFIFLGIIIGYAILAAFFQYVIIDLLVTRWLNKSHRFRHWRSETRADVEERLRESIMSRYASANLTYRNLAFSSDTDLTKSSAHH